MNVFEITNLACTYNEKSRPVLFIERLEIQKGKLTVILGQSGSGKSTLIEALGLMNNTILGGEVLYRSPEEVENVGKLWKKRSKMAKIRRDYFSFIFQDDYLMPYYSCEENVLIARLIQEKIGRSEKDALLAGPIGKMGLSGNGIMKRFPYQLAGGQKQRLSFIRAILKDFDVLFGDEPTGNLDYQNSEHLFEFIKSKLQNKANSAIIVSHNIELSVAMADTIIVLTRAAEGSEFNFELKQENVFDRTSGKEYAGYKDPDDLIRFIKEIMSA